MASSWPEWSANLGMTSFPTENGQAPGKVTLSGGWTLAIGAKSSGCGELDRSIQTLM